MMHLWANLWRACDLFTGVGYIANFDKVDILWIEKVVKTHSLGHNPYVRIQLKIQQPYHSLSCTSPEVVLPRAGRAHSNIAHQAGP